MIGNFTSMYPDSMSSFAHIVLGDYNLDRKGHIRWCLDTQYNEWYKWRWLEEKRESDRFGSPYTLREFERMAVATKAFLELLYTFEQKDLDRASLILYGEEVEDEQESYIQITLRKKE